MLRCLDNNNLLRVQNVMNEKWITFLTNPNNQISFLKNNLVIDGQLGR
jgi:hypothetical protein